MWWNRDGRGNTKNVIPHVRNRLSARGLRKRTQLLPRPKPKSSVRDPCILYYYNSLVYIIQSCNAGEIYFALVHHEQQRLSIVIIMFAQSSQNSFIRRK